MAKTRYSLALDPSDAEILKLLVHNGYGDMTEVLRGGLRLAYAQFLSQNSGKILCSSAPKSISLEAVTFDGIVTWGPERIKSAFESN